MMSLVECLKDHIKLPYQLLHIYIKNYGINYRSVESLIDMLVPSNVD